MGAPRTWGLLLRTIDTRPRELTCITTSGQEIIAACGDIVNIYDAVTGVLQQSLSASEPVIKIQVSPDGTTLFFVHSYSVTMWDVQTGGLIHTFTTKSWVNDIAVSTSGDYIACGLSNSFVRFWNTRTKKEGKGFGGSQPIVAICWLPPQKLVVVTQNSLYIRAVTTGETLDIISIPDHVWGMIYFSDKDEFLVGTSEPGEDKELCSFRAISNQHPKPLKKRLSNTYQGRPVRRKICWEKQSPTHPGQLMHPTLVGKDVVCITPPMGVQTFNTSSHDWTSNPPLLKMAVSVTVSLNRNLVVQTKDSIQIFSTDVLTSGEARNDTWMSQVYPLDKNRIICVLQPTNDLAVLELEALRELSRDDKALQLRLSLIGAPAMGRNGSFPFRSSQISSVMTLWLSGTSLPGAVGVHDPDKPWLLYGLSPAGTKIATAHNRELLVKDTKNGDTLAMEYSEYGGFGREEVYDITFGSETRFYLKIDGPGQHVQIPFDITPSPSHGFSHTITEGKLMSLSEPRATPPYTLDANCEWVLDAQSRKICWISPGDLRRGDGGHFWAGQSLVMVGDDGVVRKVSFREPDT